MLYNRKLSSHTVASAQNLFWDRFNRWRRIKRDYLTKKEKRILKQARFWGMWHYHKPVYEKQFRDFLAFCAKRGWFGRYYTHRLGRNQIQVAHELSVLINAKAQRTAPASPNLFEVARLKRLAMMRRRIEFLEKGEVPDALKRLAEARLSHLPDTVRRREELLNRLRDRETSPASNIRTSPSAPSLPQISSLY